MFQFFRDLNDKLKMKFVGTLTLVAKCDSPLFGTSWDEYKTFQLYENGFGKRKVKGSKNLVNQWPPLIHWLNGGPFPSPPGRPCWR